MRIPYERRTPPSRARSASKGVPCSRRGLALLARPGLSLLEVLVALAIFLIAMGVLGHMINLATERAVEVQQRGEATQLCQSKLNEVMAGAVELVSQSEVPMEEDPNWLWSLEPETTEIPGLWKVNVRVSRERGNGERIECVLSQMVLDPTIRGSAFDTPAAAVAVTDTAAPGSTDGGSSSTPPSSGSGGSPNTQPSSGGTGSGGSGGSISGPPRTGGQGNPGSGSGSSGTAPQNSTPQSGNQGPRGTKP